MRRVLLLYGGRSAEHAISCLSARSVVDVVDPSRYDVVTVGITRGGRWTRTDGVAPATSDRRLPEVADDGPTVALVGTRSGPRLVEFDADDAEITSQHAVDVAFPLLHGPWGEDGTVQGLLATVGVPYVGADVTASSIGVDKAAMKASFTARGLPQLAYQSVHRRRWEADEAGVRADLAAIPLPWFVKPARQGSSIGITKVREPGELSAAMHAAFDHAVVEEGLEGAREIEVGVLGDGEVQVTRPGEILPTHEFYDFEAKYLDTSELVIPADVDAWVVAETDRLARIAYQAIGCRGLARVDFFLRGDELVVNEINTIPGFTPASMFPQLWAAEGLPYARLVDRLLTDARV